MKNLQIARLYGVSPTQMTTGRAVCMDCHGTIISGKESREVLDGVGCESCHGPAASWLEPHKDETNKELGRSRPGHQAALRAGKLDLRDTGKRAATCAGCHYITEPRLLSAGHPSGADFDYVRGMSDVRHWQHRVPDAQIASATRAVVSSRGPVPKVRVASAAAGSVGSGTGSSRAAGSRRSSGSRARAASGSGAAASSGAIAQSFAADRRAEAFVSRPPAPRPVVFASGDSEDEQSGAVELPAFPDLADATLEDVLLAVQKRLKLLYRLVWVRRMSEDAALGKTTIRRLEQYRDRWSSYDTQTGLVEISDKLSPKELKEIEIFSDFDDRFLEKISPDISIARWQKGAVLFEEGTYIDLAFYVLEGAVEILVEGVGPQTHGSRPIFDLSRTVIGEPAEGTDHEAGQETGAAPSGTVLMRRATRAAPTRITLLSTMDFDLPEGMGAHLGEGELIGEIGSMSGWPQSVTARTAEDCRLVQIKVAALRLMKRKSKKLKANVDRLYRERSLAVHLKNTPLFQSSTDLFIDAVKETVELVSCEPNEEIVKAGEPADALYLVRSGFVKLLQDYADGEIAVSYLSKGMTLGEVELLVEGLDGWQSTAKSVEYAELVKIPRSVVDQMVQGQPRLRDELWRTATDRIREAGTSRRNVAVAEFTEVALQTGLVQGNSILAIDLNACTRCDDCVKACAATHDGRPRFVREGNKYGNLLVAKSCYHCRDPVCLVGCPTGAIHRAGVGETVAVDEEVCIGCSNCANNCPYDAIMMHDTESVWPEDMIPTGLRGRDRAVASKCDLCADTGHGPACVSNCPQGCAYRVGSLEEFQLLLSGEAR